MDISNSTLLDPTHDDFWEWASVTYGFAERDDAPPAPQTFIDPDTRTPEPPRGVQS